ncbi:hypothetical protein OROHE_023123 [Orobanche hederae]
MLTHHSSDTHLTVLHTTEKHSPFNLSSNPRFRMDLCLSSTFRPFSPPEYSYFRWDLYRALSRQLSSKSNSSRRTTVVMAQRKPKIDGVSDELNSIASQNLDHASARRRVRSAFANVQQQLDHILFKMVPAGIRTEEGGMK